MRPSQACLEPLSLTREAEFIEAVRRSEGLHRPWIAAPQTPEQLRAYVEAKNAPNQRGYFVLTPGRELAGVINVSEIVMGGFCSGYLGYYAFVPHHGRGHMRAGLAAVVDVAFGEHGMHRLEANIQPANRASVGLVRRLGFRREGFSPRYLKIGGRWRDHERWAITVEDWQER